MSQYPNYGILFKNDRKREGTKDPDRSGHADITCPHCKKDIALWVSGWIKIGPKGRFLSLAFKLKDAKPLSKPSAPAPGPDDGDPPPF